MARPSKWELERREQERQEEINKRAIDMVREMMPGIVAGLVGKLHTETDGASTMRSDGKEVDIESLATAMVRASNPKNRTQSLDPSVLKKRKEAYVRMSQMLQDARDKTIAARDAMRIADQQGDYAEVERQRATIEGNTPLYKLRSKVQLSTQVIDPQWKETQQSPVKDTEIEWFKPPNEAMVPMNAIAKKIFAEYKAWIGRAVAREGMPAAPWLLGVAPWINTAGGIVRGRAAPMPEMSAGERAAAADEMFPDPRRSGPAKARPEHKILGSLHPGVTEGA